MTRLQRTVFGEVADTYDELRPTYPAAVVDRVVELAALPSRARVLDIGCGTGILAAAFIERGHLVLGIEPSADMARIARRKFAGNLDFRLHLVDFQAWSPGQERFDLAVAGQSWHWMDPATRFAHAARALRDDGHLALLWNSPQRRESDLRSALDEAYATHAPDLAGDPPGGKAGLAGADPAEEIEASDAFDLVEVIEEPWSRTYDAEQYLRLLATQSDHRLLDDEARDGLFDAISGAIDGAGGSIEIDYVCRAFVARRG